MHEFRTFVKKGAFQLHLPESISSSARKKRILAKIFALPFNDVSPSIAGLAGLLEVEESELSNDLNILAREGLVQLDSKIPKLTGKGREAIVVVFAGGSFDIIHPGHIETLEASKALGDVLIVSVARNSTFERNKKRKPFFDEKIRRKSVSAIRCVDAAVLGSETDIFETVEKVKPDIVTIGYDQAHQESIISEESKKRGLKVRVVRLGSSIPDVKTSKLLSENPELARDS
jgi:cytidyltransferase-like protein